MGRSVRIKFAGSFAVLALLSALVGCSSSTPGTSFPTPSGITLAPATNLSIDLGKVQSFTASAHNAANPPITLTVPIAFHSSNTAVVTIANNGLACAGTWNSLSNPQICTPGASGVAEITATSAGVSSPPTTIYVHQHVDSVTVTAVDPPTTSCLSKGGLETFAAKAFSQGTDITTSVGQFTWQSFNGQVVTVSNTLQGLTLDQAQATASTPGFTQIFASVAGVNSLPIPFTTCAVKQITLAVTGTTATSYTVTQGTSKTITPTVTDTLDVAITGVSLTWCSSDPTIAFASGTNCTSSSSDPFSVSNSKAGGATIIASCTPPSCNVGFNPALPIYPAEVITAVVNPTSGTTPSGTLYVSSTACPTTTNCAATAVVPISYATTDTVGGPVGLSANPNSILFGPQGTAFFMGTDLGLQGTKGVMRVDVSGTSPAVSEFTSVTGKVLAVSPTGGKVIFSDTIQTPNQVFVFDNSTNVATSFQITNATAAAFSPDGLKAFIIAGSNLYVYSTINALQTIPMGFTGSGVTFLNEGAFGYIVGPSQITVRRTCDNAIAVDTSLVQQVIPLPGTPSIIKSLRDTTQVLAVDSPNVDVIGVSTAPSGCQPAGPGEGAYVSDTLVGSFNLGQGTFTAKEMFISPDGANAYIVATDLPSIPVFSITNHISSAIALTGNVTPLAAALSPDGSLLFVSTTDGSIHVLDTLIGSDIRQITFPPTSYLCAESDATALYCPADLLAIKP